MKWNEIVSFYTIIHVRLVLWYHASSFGVMVLCIFVWCYGITHLCFPLWYDTSSFGIMEFNCYPCISIFQSGLDLVKTAICIGNNMITSTIKDLHYKWYLKIVPKLFRYLHEQCESFIVRSNIMFTCLLYTWQNYICQPLHNANNSGHHVMIVTDRRTHVYNCIMTVECVINTCL